MINSLFKIAKAIKENPYFEKVTIAVILLAGILVGVQTFKTFAASHHALLLSFDTVITLYFILEILIKLLAEGKKPWRYFASPWNIFDFLIVAILLLPVKAEFITAFRLVRVFRVFRLVTALPKLQMIVSALLKSIPSMGYVSLLLFILFYMYAVMATFLFGANDPVHFGSLPLSFLSLFRAVTLEDWTDLMYIQMYGCSSYGYELMPEQCLDPASQPIGAALFFVSFIMMGSMIILNLFIGVIMQSMGETHKENEKLQEQSLDKKSLKIKKQLDKIDQDFASLKREVQDLYQQKQQGGKG